MANSMMQNIMGMKSMGGLTPQQLASQGGMSMPQMLQQMRQFKSMFHGNAQQRVMEMVQNGTRTNAQLQQAMEMAKQFQGMF